MPRRVLVLDRTGDGSVAETGIYLDAIEASSRTHRSHDYYAPQSEREDLYGGRRTGNIYPTTIVH
jgi:hypothetical protein